MADIGLFHKRMSVNRFFSYSASSPAKAIPMISKSIVDRDIHVCFFYFQESVALPKVNTYPFMDLVSSEFNIQLASQYPSSTAGYLS